MKVLDFGSDSPESVFGETLLMRRERRDLKPSRDVTLRIARIFAEALDREDYDSAAAVLSTDARYIVDDEEHIGPTAIVASYRASGDWAAKTLEGVRYESRVEVTQAGKAVISFSDHIEHAGRVMTHTCEQRVEIDSSGLITRVEHHDLPGEREALAAFFRDVGVDRGET
jgi:hypothetical protein